jgi:hypothetical protein
MSTDGLSSRVRSLIRWCVFGIAIAVSGCAPSLQNPERLVPVADEMVGIRLNQDALVQQYYRLLERNARTPARLLRNEIIGQRMYAIDVQYSQYEASLTRERQEIGFATLTTAEGLSTAATLVAPATTKTILSGLTTAVIATKGHYDSEVLLAQTIQTIQKQMRASRNRIAEQINRRMTQDVTDYPLAAAMADVEAYYRAGTLTTGIIDTSTVVGIEEDKSRQKKDEIARLPATVRLNAVLRDTTTPIAPPVRVPVIVHEGKGPFEQRLLPARIKEFQRVVCVEQNGRFSAELRDAVLKHLGDKKDPAFPGQITVRDGQIMRNEFRAIAAGTQPNPCP